MDKDKILEAAEISLDKIRPFLEKDGGNIKLIDVDEKGHLQLEFLGNCSTCSMSKMTFKNGIEESVMRDVPEITGISVINLTEELI